ncbi:hypothetical protein C7M84_000796 [Penaeus vannamei]|uniref:Uncharacterized protein n=1 Tax=Penaeus vannamei TaxID=6689 RepID=A0A3R7Q4M8_PENVA|nr:hypothetical protein C7M84_000796 [Penaeus vannamei]
MPKIPTPHHSTTCKSHPYPTLSRHMPNPHPSHFPTLPRPHPSHSHSAKSPPLPLPTLPNPHPPTPHNSAQIPTLHTTRHSGQSHPLPAPPTQAPKIPTPKSPHSPHSLMRLTLPLPHSAQILCSLFHSPISAKSPHPSPPSTPRTLQWYPLCQLPTPYYAKFSAIQTQRLYITSTYTPLLHPVTSSLSNSPLHTCVSVAVWGFTLYSPSSPFPSPLLLSPFSRAPSPCLATPSPSPSYTSLSFPLLALFLSNPGSSLFPSPSPCYSPLLSFTLLLSLSLPSRCTHPLLLRALRLISPLFPSLLPPILLFSPSSPLPLIPSFPFSLTLPHLPYLFSFLPHPSHFNLLLSTSPSPYLSLFPLLPHPPILPLSPSPSPSHSPSFPFSLTLLLSLFPLIPYLLLLPLSPHLHQAAILAAPSFPFSLHPPTIPLILSPKSPTTLPSFLLLPHPSHFSLLTTSFTHPPTASRLSPSLRSQVLPLSLLSPLLLTRPLSLLSPFPSPSDHSPSFNIPHSHTLPTFSFSSPPTLPLFSFSLTIPLSHLFPFSLTLTTHSPSFPLLSFSPPTLPLSPSPSPSHSPSFPLPLTPHSPSYSSL